MLVIPAPFGGSRGRIMSGEEAVMEARLARRVTCCLIWPRREGTGGAKRRKKEEEGGAGGRTGDRGEAGRKRWYGRWK